MRAAFIAVILAGGASMPSQAVEVEPVYSFQLLGGQYFFAGEKGNLSGNAGATFTPAVKFNDRWALVPTVASTYQGTKQVVDLVGAGSIFQEQMDHRVSTRLLYTAPGGKWRLKPNLAFKAQLLKETRDEDWGKGLFDYRRVSGGLEAEYVYRDPFSIRLSADYFFTHFPNYSSLESQAGLDPNGNPLARELAGGQILNHYGQAGQVGFSALLAPRVVLETAYQFQRLTYPRQHVVTETGAFSEPTRVDYVHGLTAGLKVPAQGGSDLQMVWTADIGGAYASSNQHSYDARRTRFLRHFYNYGEFRFSPGLKMLWGDQRQPITVGLGAAYWYRWYPHRPIQDNAGTYQSQSLKQHNWMASTSATYPMAPHFNLVFNFQYGRASSNQRYEQTYAYNYTVTNYLFGFSYDY